MRILVTGGKGFTGRHFSKRAKNLGHEVISIDGDITDEETLKNEIQGLKFDAAINFAAISSVGHKKTSDFYSVNVLGAMNFLEAILATKTKNLKRIILVSSAHVYGDPSSHSISESSKVAPKNHYAMSKLSMELMSKSYFSDLPVIIVRPFNYTGPGQSNQFVVPKIIEHFVKAKSSIELGNIDVEREYNDVRFVCDAYIAILSKGQIGETYNVCTGRTVSVKKIISILSDKTKHEMMVNINKRFFRKNEIQRLCGDPSQLKTIMSDFDIVNETYTFQDTLNFMLKEDSF